MGRKEFNQTNKIKTVWIISCDPLECPPDVQTISFVLMKNSYRDHILQTRKGSINWQAHGIYLHLHLIPHSMTVSNLDLCLLGHTILGKTRHDPFRTNSIHECSGYGMGHAWVTEDEVILVVYTSKTLSQI